MTQVWALAFLLPAAPQAQISQKRADAGLSFFAFDTCRHGSALGSAKEIAVVLQAGYAVADSEGKRAITLATPFESGLLVKQCTAVALS